MTREDASVLSPIDELIGELKQGRPIVVVDDEDRENEGDIIIPAATLTPELMAFAIRHTGGVVCVAMPDELADHLELPPMVKRNDAPRKTAFTVSIEAKHGVTTGISARDRATTIRTLVKPEVAAGDLVRPGHVFPLRARPRGVLERAGHTEATVDLCRLAGLPPVGALSELMNDDGTMMRLPRIAEFARAHKLKVGAIADLLRHRVSGEAFVRQIACAELPTEAAAGFRLHGFAGDLDGREHVAMVLGAVDVQAASLVRIHRECLIGESLGGVRCDCGGLRDAALARMADEGHGVLVYLRRGPGDGGWLDEAKAHLEGPSAEPVLRPLDYAAAAQMLAQLGVTQVRLLSDDQREAAGLAACGARVTERIPLRGQHG